MENIEVGGNVLNELVEIGVKTDIDDFGTGHSSLLRLKKIAFNALKIDRSFVNDMLNDQNSAIIVEAIISMSKSLGLKTIAEGIEKKEQLDHLKVLGCDYAQGYYFSKPVEANDILELIEPF